MDDRKLQIRDLLLHEMERTSVQGQSLRDVDLDDLMTFAKAYARLSPLIQESLRDLVLGDHGSVSRKLLEDIQDHLGGFNEELDDVLKLAEDVGNDE